MLSRKGNMGSGEIGSFAETSVLNLDMPLVEGLTKAFVPTTDDKARNVKRITLLRLFRIMMVLREKICLRSFGNFRSYMFINLQLFSTSKRSYLIFIYGFIDVVG